MEKDRTTLYTIFLILAICIIALVAVIYTFIITLRTIRFGKVEALEPDRPINIFISHYNYDFKIPTNEDIKSLNPNKRNQEKTNNLPIKEQDQNINSNYKTVNYNFNIPKLDALLPQLTSIQIPAIAYNSPIIISDDANTGIDNGAWLYPSSKHPLLGEAIFLCHRRYFKKYDPKSCWNLDKIQKGDFVYLNLSNDTQITYKVISVSVTISNDINIYSTSNEKLLKLISCSKRNGKIGSDSHRITVLAKAIN